MKEQEQETQPTSLKNNSFTAWRVMNAKQYEKKQRVHSILNARPRLRQGD